jgi:hypothetical protein
MRIARRARGADDAGDDVFLAHSARTSEKRRFLTIVHILVQR